CREDGDCKNGASCHDNVCLCEPGYEGEKCEKIKNCEELKCDTEISDCVLDEKTTTGMCKCKDISKLYYEKQCVACREDGDCKNGASCQDNVCLCEPGYEGEKCEKIKNCEELKCDAEISDCVLDEKSTTGMCKCKDISKLYYEKQCVACREDGDCKNGALCQDNVCLCEPGYEGEKCEKIKNCEELKCDTEISDCVLDEKTSTGVCKCKDISKLYYEKQCVGKLRSRRENYYRMCKCKDISKLYYEKQCVACREDGDCKNGASCQDNVCLCEPGYEGEKCEKIKNCEELKCDTEISDCVLDEKTSTGVCKCKDISKLYYEKQCV
ncbi:hypothetical protein TNCT_200953, partial [Trichonephila clavata]